MIAEAIADRAPGHDWWRQYLPAAVMLGPLVVFLIAFYIVPFGVMLEESLQWWQGDTPPAGADAMTLHQYEKTFESSRSSRAIIRTLRISAFSVLFSFLLSYPVALLLLRVGRQLRSAILLITFISLAASLIVRNYGWLVVLADQGPVNNILVWLGVFDYPQRMVYNEWAIVIALVHYSLPFMILPIYGSLLRIPASHWEAPRTLGAGVWRSLGTVILPLSMPGIFGGTMLSFAVCMSAFVTPLMLGSPSTAMVSQVAAEQLLVQLNFAWGSAIIFVLTAVTFVIVLIYALLVRRVMRVHV